MSLFDDLAGQVQTIRVESEFFPPVELDQPFQPGPPNPYLQRLRPKITLEFAGGALAPITIAPYGEPDPDAWPRLRNALLVAGALAGWGFVVYRLRRRR